MTPERWSLIRAVFEQAVAVDPDTRDAFLAQRCADDRSLHDEVLRMLAASTDDDRLVPAGAIDLEAIFDDSLPPSSICLENNRYVLGDPIGEGGMGVVFEATRADGTFDQRVAIKVLKRGMDTEDIVRRFRQERQVLANLQHPSITQLIDGGTTSDGRPYLVMEFIDGAPIDTYIRTHALDIRARIQLIIKVCDAVAYAHQNLVIHRDLKPSNILVEANGDPRLLDFGVAKVLQPDRDIAVTSTGQRVHTPRYASPEQVQGHPVSTATDVYSLGVILYELLTGCSPYAVDATTSHTLEQAVCKTEPARPSTVVAAPSDNAPERSRHQRRVLRGDLDLIVLKALRKDPVRRYASVEALADDLSRWLRGDPILARPDSWSYRARRFVGRYRLAVAATAAIILTLVAALATTTVSRLNAERREQAAEWRTYVSLLAAADALTRPSIASQRPREAGLLLEQAPEHHRAWEWDYLWQRRDQSVLRIETAYRLWSMAFSPDGRVVATGAGESSGQLHLWSPTTGAKILTFRGTTPEQPPRILSLNWSPDGSHFAAVSQNGTVGLWDPEQTEPIAVLPKNGAPVTAVTHAPDGSGVVTLERDGSLVAWDLVDGAVPRERWRQPSTPSSSNIAVTRGGLVLVPDAAGGILVHDGASGRQIDVIAASTTPARSVRVADDRVVSLHADGTVAVTSTVAFDQIRRTRPPDRFQLQRNQAISRSGRLAAGIVDNTVVIWHVDRGTVIARLHGLREADEVTDLAFSPDERRIAVSCREVRQLILWTIPPTPPTWPLGEERDAPAPTVLEQIAFSADSSLLAAARRGSIEVYDVATGLRLRRIDVGNSWVSTVAFLAPEIGQIVSGFEAGVQWWNVQTGELVRELHGRTGRRVAVDHARTRLAWGADGGKVRIVDAATGMLIRELTGATLPVQSVAFSPDGSRIVAGTGVDDAQETCDARAIVWNTHDGRRLQMLAGFDRKIQAVTIADDGQVFAAGFKKSLIRWRPGDDAPAQYQPRGTQWRIWSLAVSPDARRLVVGCPDSAIRILDVATGDEVLAVPWDPNVKDAVFSDDGRYLAAGSYNGSAIIQVWDTAPATDRVAAVAVRMWHDALDGDWALVRDALIADANLTDGQRAEALAHVERLVPWFTPVPARDEAAADT